MISPKDATRKLAEDVGTILGRREKIPEIHQLIVEHVEARLKQQRERVERAITHIKAAKRISLRGKQTIDLINARECLEAAFKELEK